jgi:hypothetical protein
MASASGIEVIPASAFASYHTEAKDDTGLHCQIICRADDSLGHLTGDWRISVCSSSKIVTSFKGTQLFNAAQLGEYGFTQEVIARDLGFPVNNTVTTWKDVDVQVAERSLAVSSGRDSEGAASDSEGAAADSEGAASDSEGAASDSEGAASGSEGAASGSEGAASGSEGAASGSEGAASNSEGAASDSEGAASNSEGAASFLRLLKETFESTHQAGACTREVENFGKYKLCLC